MPSNQQYFQFADSGLKVEVTNKEIVLSRREDLVVCVVSHNKNYYSETFIKAHISYLPTKVEVLYGYPTPYYSGDDRPLLARTIPHRLKRVILQRTFKLSEDYFNKSAVKQFLANKKVNAVLAETGMVGVVMMDVCRETGIPLVVHFHGADAYRTDLLEQDGKHYPELFNSAAAIIAVSHDMEQQLLLLGASREKLYHNPYGVELSLFQGARPDQAPPTFVAVGRFVDKKAPHLTLLAFKQVIENIPEAQLIMIGDGPLLEACKQLVRALDIGDAVDFRGARSHDEVAGVMQQARGFVQHSVRATHGDSEGTPVAVLEAGAAGLPIVATRHAGIKDVVIDGKTGFLVAEGDINGMATGMIRLAKDPVLAAEFGSAGRERIRTGFSMEKSIGNLWQIIETAINTH